MLFPPMSAMFPPTVRLVLPPALLLFGEPNVVPETVPIIMVRSPSMLAAMFVACGLAARLLAPMLEPEPPAKLPPVKVVLPSTWSVRLVGLGDAPPRPPMREPEPTVVGSDPPPVRLRLPCTVMFCVGAATTAPLLTPAAPAVSVKSAAVVIVCVPVLLTICAAFPAPLAPPASPPCTVMLSALMVWLPLLATRAEALLPVLAPCNISAPLVMVMDCAPPDTSSGGVLPPDAFDATTATLP